MHWISSHSYWYEYNAWSASLTLFILFVCCIYADGSHSFNLYSPKSTSPSSPSAFRFISRPIFAAAASTSASNSRNRWGLANWGYNEKGPDEPEGHGISFCLSDIFSRLLKKKIFLIGQSLFSPSRLTSCATWSQLPSSSKLVRLKTKNFQWCNLHIFECFSTFVWLTAVCSVMLGILSWYPLVYFDRTFPPIVFRNIPYPIQPAKPNRTPQTSRACCNNVWLKSDGTGLYSSLSIIWLK